MPPSSALALECPQLCRSTSTHTQTLSRLCARYSALVGALKTLGAHEAEVDDAAVFQTGELLRALLRALGPYMCVSLSPARCECVADRTAHSAGKAYLYDGEIRKRCSRLTARIVEHHRFCSVPVPKTEDEREREDPVDVARDKAALLAALTAAEGTLHAELGLLADEVCAGRHAPARDVFQSAQARSRASGAERTYVELVIRTLVGVLASNVPLPPSGSLGSPLIAPMSPSPPFLSASTRPSLRRRGSGAATRVEWTDCAGRTHTLMPFDSAAPWLWTDPSPVSASGHLRSGSETVARTNTWDPNGLILQRAIKARLIPP